MIYNNCNFNKSVSFILIVPQLNGVSTIPNSNISVSLNESEPVVLSEDNVIQLKEKYKEQYYIKTGNEVSAAYLIFEDLLEPQTESGNYHYRFRMW